MLADKIRVGIRGAILLHREFGVSYFNILKSLLKKDKTITIHVKNVSITKNIYEALYITKSLQNIEKNNWRISNVVSNLVIYENKQRGIKLYTRTDNSLDFSFVVDEVFVQEVYKADFKNKVVIDVGAYLGESAIYFAINGAKKVIALEPDEENYKLALMNIKENGLDNKIVLLNNALAPKEGVINLYRYSYPSDLGSTDSDNMPKHDFDKLIVKQVEATTLDRLIKISGEERIGLLKLDCEGCEYSILNSFSNFDVIENIVLEYHNGLQNLPIMLKDRGFKIAIEKRNEKLGILRAFKK
mgnify:CR=1 FL=1